MQEGQVSRPSRQDNAQAARRARIIEAVLDLAAEGGPEAVRARAIAERADVSSRTLYKYFASIEELLIAAVRHWRDDIAARSVELMTGNTVFEHVQSLYRYNWDAFAKAPNLVRTFLFVQSFPAAHGLDWGRDTLYPLIDAELEVFDADFAADFRMILGDVAYAAFMLGASGYLSFDESWSHIERTVARLAGDQLSPVPRHDE